MAGLQRKNTEYDEYVGQEKATPGMQVLMANEEPSAEEQAHWDDLYADFTDELLDNQQRAADKMLQNAPEPYVGISDVAFTLLKGVYTKHVNREGDVPQSVLFGEGGMIHTAVDVVAQYAITKGIEGADSQDQYTAAQVNMMKKVGELVQSESDDSAVEEAQDLLVDVEMADGDTQPPTPDQQDRDSLNEIEIQNQPAAPQEEPPPQQAPQAPPAQGGGLI